MVLRKNRINTSVILEHSVKKCVVIVLFIIFNFAFFNISSISQTKYSGVNIDYFTINEGLPENSVTAIFQDYLGYMWFSTQNGLVKFDGMNYQIYNSFGSKVGLSYGTCFFEDERNKLWIGTTNGLLRFDRYNDLFYHYLPEPKSGNIIEANYVMNIYGWNKKLIILTGSQSFYEFDPENSEFTKIFNEPGISINYNFYSTGLGIKNFLIDSNHTLWICSSNGLWTYNFSNKKKNVFFYSKNKRSKINLQNMAQDAYGNIWLGTNGNGLIKLNPISGQTFVYHKEINNNYSLVNDSCEIFIDTKHRIWVQSRNYLSKLNPDNGTFEHFYFESQGFIPSIIKEDRNGNLWIIEKNNYENSLVKCYVSIIYFDTNSEKFYYELKQENIQNENLSNVPLSSFFLDRTNTIWLGTRYNGGLKYSKMNNRLRITEELSGFGDTLDIINLHLNSDTVWFNTADANIFSWDSKKKSLNSWNTKSKLLRSSINCLLKYEDYLIIGTNNGLFKLNLSNSKIEQFLIVGDEKKILNQVSIVNLLKDGENNIWIAAFNGLYQIKKDIKNNNFIINKYFGNDIIDANLKPDPFINSIKCIYQDGYGQIWISAGTNIYQYKLIEDRFKKLDYQGDGVIYDLQFDDNDLIWISTINQGLIVYQPKKNKIVKKYDNLRDRSMYDLEKDLEGKIWVSTMRGLYQFNPINFQYFFYSNKDGLKIKTYNRKSIKITSNGKIIYAGKRIFQILNPKNIIHDTTELAVLITSFKANNQRLNQKFRNPLKDTILEEARKIDLKYNQNIITIDFAALHYIRPEDIEYSYKLDGVEDDWQYVGNNRSVNYSGLKPGKYRFHVKAKNIDGVWSKNENTILIQVFPPIWKTWWAYLLYTFIFLYFIYFIRKYELKRIRIKHELSKKSFETKKLVELDNFKSRFFANVSHELRTPLTLIVGYLGNALNRDEIETQVKDMLKIAMKNAQRLKLLINQILDMSKLDEGKLKLELVEDDVIAFLKPRVYSFESLAESKGSILSVNFSTEKLQVLFDPDKLETIINNLLSNAIKFTHSGKISFDLSVNQDFLFIKVKDTGIGIPDNEKNKIFERYYQVHSNELNLKTGTGLGLSLTKELVELHHGTIEFISTPGVGTEFIVKLPVLPMVYSADFLTGTKINPYSEIEYTQSELLNGINHPDITNKSGPLILIVEDNFELRKFIHMDLQVNANPYQIIEASDGVMGYEMAIKKVPDLIIMDWMMPKMDGLELCTKIKNDFNSCHIPIIMLTAKADLESKLNGLDKGADAYLTKPFETVELHALIDNLLVQRARLKEKFSRNILGVIPEELCSMDEKFLDKVKGIIDKELMNPKLDVQFLSHEISLSRSQLFRKLKALTDLSPNEYIRLYRLEKAYQRLKNGVGNVSEVAYTSGFENLSYFSKCFFERYHLLPSELINNCK